MAISEMNKNITNYTVSVIMPCFNASHTVEATIKSVLQNTYAVNEILIYDDHSTDNSIEIIEQLATSDKRVRLIRGERNRGAGFARDTLLKQVKSDIIAFLDTDDTWHPNKIEEQLEIMTSKNADIVCSSYNIISEDGQLLNKRIVKQNINFYKMHWANQIPTSFSIFRADLIGADKMPHLRRRQDYAFWMVLFSSNPFLKCVGTDKIHGCYSLSNGSLSSNKYSNILYNYKVFRQVLGYHPLFSAICVFLNIIEKLSRSVAQRVF
jgi:teichuronic acid biosynthesis glycosyltransferase TuaG